MDVAEKSFVTTHVVIIDRLFQERDGAGDEKIFGLGGFAELMKTKAGVEKSGTGVGSDAAQSLAHAKCESPLLFPHQMMKTKLKNFGAVLVAFIDGVEFGERLACHA